MNLLDMRTVLLGNVVSNAICAAVMIALWLMNRRRSAGLGLWAADYFMQLVAVLLLALRGVVPISVSIGLACPLIVAGTFLLYLGLERFTGRTNPQRFNYLFLALNIAVHLYYTFVQPSMLWRNINFSLALVVLCSQCAWLLLRRVSADMQPVTRMTGVVFCALSLFSLARVFINLAVPPDADMFKLGLYDVLAVLAYQMLFIALTFSLSLMLNRHLVGALESDIEGRKSAGEALRESRRALLALMSNLPGMAYRCRNDKDWTMEFVSQGALALTGYTAEELTRSSGVSYAQVVHPDDWKMVWDDVQLALADRRPYQLSYRIVTANGVEKWVWEQGSGIFSEEGVLLALEGFITDISDRKRAEVEKEKLEAQNRQLQKAESLGRMAGAIAHHYNNLLGVVLGNLEIALDDMPRGSGVDENLSEAMKAARRAAEVSSLMLTYLGMVPGKLEPLDLSEACRKNLSILKGVMPNTVDLKADLPTSGPMVMANAHQIQKVLNNLATNAWESLGEAGGVVHLAVKTVSRAEISTRHRFPLDWQPQDNLYACLEVTDTGGGISEKDFEKVFDPFFSSKFTGRGLGLPVVLGVVRSHLGGITVESKQGHGSVFRVFFPLSAAVVPRLPQETVKAPDIREGGTVLVVEDDDAVRKVAKVVLARLGHAALEARDGIEALEVFQQHRQVIRCVLCDLTMPRMDGWATLAALRKLSPGIPVILASGYDQTQVMTGEHAEWPQAFLGKPYQSSELREAIRQALDVRQPAGKIES
jgi:PAS domain S-box-containing protein